MSAKISATGAAVFEFNFRRLTKQEIIDAGGNVREPAVGVEPPARWTPGIGRQRRDDALFLTWRQQGSLMNNVVDGGLCHKGGFLPIG